MAEQEFLSELRAIAELSAKAADAGGTEAALLESYETLRARAETLALAHGWSTSEDQATRLPSAEGLREIERLDQAFGPELMRAGPADRDMAARVSQSLLELAGWATGVRLAYETPGDDAGTGP